MEANELRIGNLVFDSTKCTTVIESIIPEHNRVRYAIPLTEEWLERFGFDKEPMAYSKNIDSFGGGKRITFSGDYLYIIDSETPKSIPSDIITIWNKDIIKNFYVHQLQNLYFALTGQELKLNDK